MSEFILGDCIEEMQKMESNSCDVGFTSPPYNRIRNDTYELYDDTKEDYYKFLCDFTDELIRVCKRQAIINIQMNHFNKVELCRYIGNYSNNIKGIVIWEKTNPQPATNYKDDTYSVTNAYEFFFVMGKDNEEFRANFKTKNIISTSVNSVHFDGHSAVMKEEVADYFITHYTKENETVLDCFMGMGTTGVSCAKYGRNFVGIEVIPKYYNEAKERVLQAEYEASVRLF